MEAVVQREKEVRDSSYQLEIFACVTSTSTRMGQGKKRRMGRSELTPNLKTDNGPMAMKINEIGGLVRWQLNADVSLQSQSAVAIQSTTQIWKLSVEFSKTWTTKELGGDNRDGTNQRKQGKERRSMDSLSMDLWYWKLDQLVS